MARAVAEALRKGDTGPQDSAGRALARRYAKLLDEAAPRAAYTEPLLALEALVRREGDAEAQRAFRKIRDALGEHSVASDLGPKLLAVLTALRLTPAGRGVKGGAADGVPGVTPIDRLRARHSRAAG